MKISVVYDFEHNSDTLYNIYQVRFMGYDEDDFNVDFGYFRPTQDGRNSEETIIERSVTYIELVDTP